MNNIIVFIKNRVKIKKILRLGDYLSISVVSQLM